MKYNPPYGVADPNAPYVNGDPSVGRAGSIPPAESIEYPQREIVSVITDVGLSSPNNNDLAQMSAATRFMRPQFVLDVGTANHIAITLAPAPAAWAVPLTFFVEIGANNTNTSQTVDVAIAGIATPKPLVKRTGQPVAIGDLIAGSVYLVTYDGVNCRSVGILNSEFTLPSGGGGVVSILAGNRDFYVNPATGNDANDGSTTALAWKTLQHAYNWVQTNVDLAGYNVTFHCADGTYPTGVAAVGFMRGQTGPAAIKFQGNDTTPANCLISFTTGVGFGAQDGAKYTWSGFKIQSTGDFTTHAVCQHSGSEMMIGAADFGPASGYSSGHIACGAGASLALTHNYTISGSGVNHMVASANGGISCIGLTVTIVGNPNFGVAFASAQINGSLFLATPTGIFNTYSGPATGPRYLCNGNGVIFVYGAGANYIPGSVGGSIQTGGQYF
jgi:hypothetical protein